jgi:hypothetical protein
LFQRAVTITIDSYIFGEETSNLLQGYYSQRFFQFESGALDPDFPADTVVTIGYSTTAVLTMLLVSLFLISIPIVLSVKKLPANMVNVGSNSIAISAACHASTQSKVGNALLTTEPGVLWQPQVPNPLYSPEGKVFSHDGTVIAASGLSDPDDGMEMKKLTNWESETNLLRRTDSVDQISPGRIGKEELFGQISTSRLRWGVIKMSEGWYQEHNVEGPVEHIGFGMEGDEVQAPVHMRWYA